MTSAESSGARLTHVRWRDWPVAPGWERHAAEFFATPQGVTLLRLLEERLHAGAVVYPPAPLRMLQLTPLAEVRVVILGQDPYHGPGQAEGLAFSVAGDTPIPPSLRNIFKELCRDLGGPPPALGSLFDWARQGVLLMNTCLTVEDGLPGCHARLGWEGLTTRLLVACNALPEGVVFMLWGAHAQKHRHLVDESRHFVLSSNHPSPLSALRPPLPFIGCGHFGAANRWLAGRGRKEIDWLGRNQNSVA